MHNDAYLDLCGTQKAEPGVLYVVSTPLGNLGDLTLRSIRILEACDCIACETPNITKKLLSALKIEGKNLFLRIKTRTPGIRSTRIVEKKKSKKSS